MNLPRVLIVDDSVVVRRFLTALVASDPALAVAGTASNGRIALARIAQLNPDVVTLDLEMPEMDGLQTLAALRQSHPRLPVLMVSRHTRRCAEGTMKALALGAADYVALPETLSGLDASRAFLQEQLLPRLRHLTSLGRSTFLPRPPC